MHPVVRVLKTGGEVVATGTILTGLFGGPLLIMLIGAISFGLPMFAVEGDWHGTGERDPVFLDGTWAEGLSGKDKKDQEGGEQSAGAAEPEPTAPPRLVLPERAPPVPANQAAEAEVEKVAPDLPTEDTGADGQATAGQGQGAVGSTRNVPDMSGRQAMRARRNTNPGKKCDEPVPGIEHVYGDRYRVEREVLEKYTTVQEAMKLASVNWYRNEDGKIEGFKLYRVRCGSPLTQVGLRSGDVIISVNGRQVRTLPQAFAAVRKVKKHDVIRVQLMRKGTLMTRTVQVI
jgi:hypothetical protein